MFVYPGRFLHDEALRRRVPHLLDGLAAVAPEVNQPVAMETTFIMGCKETVHTHALAECRSLGYIVDGQGTSFVDSLYF